MNYTPTKSTSSNALTSPCLLPQENAAQPQVPGGLARAAQVPASLDRHLAALARPQLPADDERRRAAAAAAAATDEQRRRRQRVRRRHGPDQRRGRRVERLPELPGPRRGPGSQRQLLQGEQPPRCWP